VRKVGIRCERGGWFLRAYQQTKKAHFLGNAGPGRKEKAAQEHLKLLGRRKGDNELRDSYENAAAVINRPYAFSP
jgi:hypothetical protein